MWHSSISPQFCLLKYPLFQNFVYHNRIYTYVATLVFIYKFPSTSNYFKEQPLAAKVWQSDIYKINTLQMRFQQPVAVLP